MGNNSSYENSYNTYNQGYIGYTEKLMNSLIFQAPKLAYHEKRNIPFWVKFIRLSNGNKISYFVLNPTNPKDVHNQKYILWSHGNAADLMSLRPTLKYLHGKLGGEIGFIAYDYEGYGFSDGECRETHCYRDIKAMIDHCVNERGIKRENLILLGQSLGTGIVSHYCHDHDWKTHVILISPYKSISRVILDPHWINPTNFLIYLIDRFDTKNKLHSMDCPITIYHGMKDELITYNHSKELFDKYRYNIELILIKNAGHNDIIDMINVEHIKNIVYGKVNFKD